MAEKNDKGHKKELKEMVNEKKPGEPVEKILTVFCQRHGITMDTCRRYYDELLKTGEVKKES